MADVIGRYECGECLDCMMGAACVRSTMIDAIRRITVEAPDDQPNGPAEAAMLRLGDALERADLRASKEAYADLCDALADDARALRVAGEAMYGDRVDLEAPAFDAGDGRAVAPRPLRTGVDRG